MSYYRNTNRSGDAFCVLAVVLVFFLIAAFIAMPFILGTGGCGPERAFEATVTRLYVDHSGSGKNSSSHYMVGTDAGVFEVDNGWMLGVWNADEIYASLREGRRYKLKTKGNKVVGWFFQDYPYIVAAVPAPATAERERGVQ